MSDKEIERLSKQITNDPDIILEGIEGELGYFMIHGHLSPKESNFQVGINTEDDPGDYPNAVAAAPQKNFRFVEDIYGGAELSLNISVDEVPPYMNWRIEHQQASIGRYKEENGTIISYRENRPVGILVFSDNKDIVAADVQFMNEALEMELYAVRDELEIDIPLDVMADMTWHLEITWVNWEFKDGSLGCTIGVEAIVE